ncbi:hypothetical protein JOB18_022770 [Solea senegalensis]|uniref:Uncharacterized protein n=1 Tax=Solea senegalensis TaxID=28829 RepID=A0AAV6RAV7_SOLSE|nr:hypothetical protein JOB18_022770 [Solea senegalensis]
MTPVRNASRLYRMERVQSWSRRETRCRRTSESLSAGSYTTKLIRRGRCTSHELFRAC